MGEIQHNMIFKLVKEERTITNIIISRVPSKIYFSSAEREYIGRSQIYEEFVRFRQILAE